MISLSAQTLEAKKDTSATESSFHRNRGLVARWVLEEGKLVCRWDAA
jgi:hypothetical protein